MTGSENPAVLLQKRLTLFGARSLKLAAVLPQNYQAQHVAKQMTRCATVRGAESRADFVHKLRIVLKELNETEVWLTLIAENSWFSAEKLSGLITENRELCRIIAAAIKTAGGFNR